MRKYELNKWQRTERKIDGKMREVWIYPYRDGKQTKYKIRLNAPIKTEEKNLEKQNEDFEKTGKKPKRFIREEIDYTIDPDTGKKDKKIQKKEFTIEGQDFDEEQLQLDYVNSLSKQEIAQELANMSNAQDQEEKEQYQNKFMEKNESELIKQWIDVKRGKYG